MKRIFGFAIRSFAPGNFYIALRKACSSRPLLVLGVAAQSKLEHTDDEGIRGVNIGPIRKLLPDFDLHGDVHCNQQIFMRLGI